MGKAENSWTVETWNPIRPDGTIDEAELRRPVETPEPTKWEVAIPAFGARQSAVVIEILWAARLCPRHRFWVLTAQLKTLPEEWPENVTLAVGPLHTQAEADAAIPALLKVKAARREVVLAPTEPIDISDYLDRGYESGGPQGWIDLPSLDAVRVRGGTTPMHPTWIRKLQQAAKMAGVPFSLTWGEWTPHVPASYRLTDVALFAHRDNGSKPVYLRDLAEDRRESWAEQHEADDVFMYRVGAAHSGSRLDGVEYPEVP